MASNSENKQPDPANQKASGSVVTDPEGNLVIIHSNGHREYMREVLQNASTKSFSIPDYLKGDGDGWKP